jgi:hypothetical protein
MSLQANNNIDALIEQNDIDTNDTCCHCLSSESLFKISCQHFICLACCELLIKKNKYTNCPQCATKLSTDLQTIFMSAISNPMTKLSYYHNFSVGDIVWAYNGNGHNWLYSKEISDQIQDAYLAYDNQSNDSSNESDDDESNSTVEINIMINNKPEIYVIDFGTVTQYPKNNPNKSRGILTFKLDSVKDLKKNKIIGVAGQLL